MRSAAAAWLQRPAIATRVEQTSRQRARARAGRPGTRGLGGARSPCVPSCTGTPARRGSIAFPRNTPRIDSPMLIAKAHTLHFPVRLGAASSGACQPRRPRRTTSRAIQAPRPAGSTAATPGVRAASVWARRHPPSALTYRFPRAARCEFVNRTARTLGACACSTGLCRLARQPLVHAI
ncbi:hypothetical protein PsYK624_098790 [Phanerochaete sordida]|uniref:Uncharacterized protein n=1 Tax=Phanerochaete sordida TaxID=48140 RepID=A0A9P3LGF5_9APHY|nr:hypothetical protein PsYK624_098790 [Phanerochaete sordida]